MTAAPFVAAAPYGGPAPVVEKAPAIRVRHLWHRFGRLDVLRDVSFDVHEGEIFGFIGPNGAGKTTTIRVMATLLEPMAGRVEIDGLDVTIDPESVRRIIGYMPDHAGVYDRVTVREYLEFFADAYRVPTAGSTYAVVDAVMELTDLTKLRDKLVITMSKGMKQRLQLARTLLHDPKVLILDEPASDLDPRARIEIRDLLVELRGMGKTIFLSSHILTELADVCTSVGVLERGRLVVAGPIHDIARRLELAQAQPVIPPQPEYGPGAPQPGYGPGASQPGYGPGAPQPGYGPGASQPGYGPGAPQPGYGPTGGALPGYGPPGGPPGGPPPGPVPGPPGAYAAPPPYGYGPAAYGYGPPAAPVPQGPPKRRAKIRALAPPDVVTATLQPLPTFVGLAPGPLGSLIVTYTGDDQSLAGVVRALVMNGVPVVGVEPERNELERIFLEVTKGEVQ